MDTAGAGQRKTPTTIGKICCLHSVLHVYKYIEHKGTCAYAHIDKQINANEYVIKYMNILVNIHQFNYKILEASCIIASCQSHMHGGHQESVDT